MHDHRDAAQRVAAENNGYVVRWLTMLDRHNPPRESSGDYGAAYVSKTGVDCVTIWPSEIRNAHMCLYLLDNGATVTPHFVAGWDGADDDKRVLLQPFPTANHIGSEGLIDYNGWMMTPTRAYHVIVRNV